MLPSSFNVEECKADFRFGRDEFINDISRSALCSSSCDTLLLKQPSFKSKVTLCDRLFTCTAPKLWNALPFELRDSKSLHIFKSKLKTHLFLLAFLS
ncbi:hypothetical protein P5673_028535 [Acropora cervicornis]|uniref:Uncharacterized protein n=1 Tax=Acropora cervicornis TaxID=6130 RepID=A0AAD9PWV5_ACRCE|nr:hypothetical protein P5673_028535 [Acropora cervicornis]